MPTGYLKYPVPVSNRWVECNCVIAKPRSVEYSGHLEERSSQLPKEMIERLLGNRFWFIHEQWYLVAITRSKGQATALASHVSRGGYSHDLQIAWVEADSFGRTHASLDEYLVFLKARP